MLGWLFLVLAAGIECTHIFTINEDFSKLKTDPELSKDVEHILKRLRSFKVAVHPRIPLLYRLLRRGMRHYAHRVADSFYVPYVYKRDNTLLSDAQ